MPKSRYSVLHTSGRYLQTSALENLRVVGADWDSKLRPLQTAQATEPTSQLLLATLFSFYGARSNSENREVVPRLFMSRVGKCLQNLKTCANKDSKFGQVTTSIKYTVPRFGSNSGAHTPRAGSTLITVLLLKRAPLVLS